MTAAPVVGTTVAMGTFVSAQVVGAACHRIDEIEAAIDRALAWFAEVEAVCSRFDPRSELMRLTPRVGEAVPVSPILFEAVRFALAVAEASGGAFDPTVGGAMEARGFDREHRTRKTVRTALPSGDRPTYRDVVLDADRATIMLRRPLVLDLGAVAKGLAVDVASRELRPFRNFALDAGGDLYFGGSNPSGGTWSVGVRHPRRPDEIVDVLHVSDVAVCTSGGYERPSPVIPTEHHLLDPRTGTSPDSTASVTVVAPTAMAADAVATAAFVLGPREGLAFLERQGVEGLILTPALERWSTPGLDLWRPSRGHDVRAATV